MKCYADWCGLDIYAETQEDIVILEALKNKLGNKSDYYYEDGDIEYKRGDITIDDLSFLAILSFAR